MPTTHGTEAAAAAAAVARKRGGYKKKLELSDEDEQIRNTLLTSSVKKMLLEQTKHKSGKEPKGWMQDEVKRLKAYPCLADCTDHTIHNRKKKMESEMKKKTPPPTQQPATITPDNRSAPHALLFSPITNKGGRPKGTTDAAKEEAKKNKDNATTCCAEEHMHLMLQAKNENLPHLPKGTMKSIIETARKKHNLPDEVKLSANTMRSRIKRGNLDGQIQSPMAPMEDALVAQQN